MSDLTKKQFVAVGLVAIMMLFAGCGGGGNGGGGDATGTEAGAAGEGTTAMEGGAAQETPVTEEITEGAGTGVGTTESAAQAGGESAFLFGGQPVNVSVNGSVVNDDGEILGNVSVVDDNQQGGDGFFDVNIYENGTVVNETGAVVGQVEVTEANRTTGQTGNQSALLFGGQPVNVSVNGSVVNNDGEFLGNVSIVDNNQQGGDGFFDVNIYENGTVVNESGDVVGQVEVNELCPTASQDSEFFLNGDSVDISGAEGDLIFDNGSDSLIDFNIIEDNQGDQPGFENVTVATNGSVINQQGEVVGQIQTNQRCQATPS